MEEVDKLSRKCKKKKNIKDKKKKLRLIYSATCPVRGSTHHMSIFVSVTRVICYILSTSPLWLHRDLINSSTTVMKSYGRCKHFQTLLTENIFSSPGIPKTSKNWAAGTLLMFVFTFSHSRIMSSMFVYKWDKCCPNNYKLTSLPRPSVVRTITFQLKPRAWFWKCCWAASLYSYLIKVIL